MNNKLRLGNKKKTWLSKFAFWRLFKKKKQGAVVLSTNTQSSIYRKRFLRNKFIIFLRKLFVIILIVTIAGVTVFVMLDIVLYLKTDKSLGVVSFLQSLVYKNKQVHVELVKGLESYGVHTYPNSVYVFQDFDKINEDQKNMQKSSNADLIENQRQIELFLAHNNSVYFLPVNKTFVDIKDQYKQQLEKDGWKFIGYKKLTDENGFAGMYFVKDNIGLRIYTITNYDIWYEIISKQEAENYLKQRILNIVSKQQAINNETDKLPEKYGLYISIPEGYRYESLKLPEIGAYLVSVFDKHDKLVLRIVPYKKQFRDLNKEELRTLGMQYLEDSNRVLNLSKSIKFEKIRFFNIFDKTKYVPVTLLIEDVDLANLKDDYKFADWYKLEYTDINDNTRKIYIKHYKYTIWILDVL